MIVDRELDAGYPKNPVPLRCFAYATRGLKMLSVKGLGESAAQPRCERRVYHPTGSGGVHSATWND